MLHQPLIRSERLAFVAAAPVFIGAWTAFYALLGWGAADGALSGAVVWAFSWLAAEIKSLWVLRRQRRHQ